MRIILFTGKGGVGKSTLSASTAVLNASKGKKTLLVSSDLAHNLSDIFQMPVGGSCEQVTTNLWALEVDILNEVKENWESVQEYLMDFFAYMGIEGILAEEIALLPGMESIFLLTRILREIDSGCYDTIIIDCAPTAGTLGLLTFADSSSTKFNKILGVERYILKLIRPITKPMKSIRKLLPKDEVYASFSEIISHIGRLGDLLRDPEISSVRLVLNPNKIAVAETKRAYTYFSLFNYPVDGIFVNKVFPDDISGSYLNPWLDIQDQQMLNINRSFLDTKIFQVPYLTAEPLGLEPLKELALSLYADLAPDDVLSKVQTANFNKTDKKVVFTVFLPNIDKTQLDIGRKENELIILAGGFTRMFMLPDSLAKAQIENAKYDKQILTVTFSNEA